MDNNELEQILGQEGFSSLDRHFARFMLRLADGAEPALGLAAALVSRQAGRGHVCLDLAESAGQPLAAVVPEIAVTARCPDLAHWLRLLRESKVVGQQGDFTPLVLDGARLYLHRYWEYEQEVAAGLLHRARSRLAAPQPVRLRTALDRLFPDRAEGEMDWQRAAAAVCALRQLCIISGGPGTGKTHTVVRIMALLQELAAPDALRIGLAAPTGKAAGRLQEAIRLAKSDLDLAPEILAAIPDEAKTIHRLLGVRRGSPAFRHHRANPLSLDILIVDEASMVDLALMAKLLRALPAGARLVLLGDKDQLASVEAGAVLGDLCGGSTVSRFSSELAGQLTDLGFREVPVGEQGGAELTDCLVLLAKSYRFHPDSGIGRLARAVNAGAIDEAVASLADASTASEVCWRPEAGQESSDLAERIIAGYRPYLQASSPEAAFAVFDSFRVLTPHRQGKTGTTSLNGWIEQLLNAARLIRPDREGSWYAGRPVLITSNNYSLGLYNGDIGLTLPDDSGRLRVFFPAGAGGFRAVSPARLSGHETAYALTVHKSQGSEFEQVLLLLPEQSSPVLTRELVYTALTRARSRFELWGGEAVLRTAVAEQTKRSSGLRDLLWK
jgi:exodeoxyribonuclease V alpha subunit